MTDGHLEESVCKNRMFIIALSSWRIYNSKSKLKTVLNTEKLQIQKEK